MDSRLLPIHYFGGYWTAMARQGTPMQDSEIRIVISLLTSTDMTIPEIAKRMGCSRSTIVAVNRRYQVRQYKGRRSSWVLAQSDEEDERELREV